MAIIVRMKSDRTVSEILDTESGDRVKGVSKVVITHDIGSVPEIDLHIISTDRGSYAVEGEAKFLARSTVDGELKAVKNIEFVDGEIINYGEPV